MKGRAYLILTLLLGGCTVPGSLREMEPLKAKLDPYNHLTIIVTTPDRDLRDSLPAFTRRLTAKIKKERAFRWVTEGKKAAVGDLKLQVEFLKGAKREEGDSPYRAVAEVIRTRDEKRLARLEVPGDDYGVVTARDAIGRTQESMSNRIARYLKSHR
jgi:hypothetical protein